MAQDSTIPAQVNAAFQRALGQHQRGELGAALAGYGQVLRLAPEHFDALHLSGVIAAQSNEPQRAVEWIDKALAVDARQAGAHFNRATALQALGRWEEALAGYDRAIALAPRFAEAYSNRGLVLQALQRTEQALGSFERAIALRGEFAEAHFNRAALLQGQGDWEAALGGYDRALALKEDYAQAWCNRGTVQRELQQLEAALGSYERAIALNPRYALAHCNRGNVLKELDQPAAALDSYREAIELNPEDAEAWSNRGAALQQLKQWEAALDSHDRAITFKPDYAEAHYNRATVLIELRRYEAAVASFTAALSIKPDLDGALGMRLHARMHLCDWDVFDAELAQLSAAIVERGAVESPFCLVAACDSPSLLHAAARKWAQQFSPNRDLGEFAERGAGGRIRVGYYSADFREHPVSVLLAGVIEAHDRDGFEVVGLSFGGERGDALRERLRGAFERFIEVGERSEGQIAQLSRGLGIDIAVDLGGYTHASRPRIFALRAAPVQVNYLGYPGTLGARYMDYVIADRMIIPAGGEGDYEEKIIYLPDSYQPNDGRRVIGERRYSREECGLPGVGFVYCCFNHSYKITPGVFAGWMRILRAVPGSVLWLSQGTECSQRNLRSQAQGQGVSGERLVFAPRLAELSEHLARHRVADLFLDTLPFNAHTTASDALWAGVPVLTRLGQGFAGRVAGSVLRAVGLDELISETQLQYEERAVQLAREPQRLAQLRARLASNRGSAPLFDTQRYTRHLEAAYVRIHERHRAGLPPAHVYVESV